MAHTRLRSFPFIRCSLAACAALLAIPLAARAAAYEDPGWDYFFDGDAASFGTNEFGALDGTWQHDQADKWDGGAPGDGIGGPGGVAALTEDQTTYLRIQDCGEPRDWGFTDPSNRRIWFGHNIQDDNPGATSVLTNGITLTFRARLSSTGTLDPIYPQPTPDVDPEKPQLTEITPWFPKGYNVTDDGQGMFTVQENGANAVGFALALDLDTPVDVGGGLVMNGQPGSGLLPGSDHVTPALSNLEPLDDSDLTNWHEFWITIVGSGTPGNYDVKVYRDGSITPTSFQVQHSIGAEFSGQYFAFGLSATSGFGAFDTDFYGYKLGVTAPISTPEPEGIACAAAAIGVLAARRRVSRPARRTASCSRR